MDKLTKLEISSCVEALRMCRDYNQQKLDDGVILPECIELIQEMVQDDTALIEKLNKMWRNCPNENLITNMYEIMKANIRTMIEIDCDKIEDKEEGKKELEFHTDEVIEEILAMIIMNPEAYSDIEDDVLYDYWAGYPWNMESLILEELGDPDELKFHNTMKSVEAEVRRVRRDTDDYNLRDIIREILSR